MQKRHNWDSVDLMVSTLLRPGDEAWSVQDLEGHVVEALAHIGPHSGP